MVKTRRSNKSVRKGQRQNRRQTNRRQNRSKKGKSRQTRRNGKNGKSRQGWRRHIGGEDDKFDLNVTVVSAHNLYTVDGVIGRADPYVRLSVLNKEKHSEFITEFTKSFEEFNKDTDDEKFNVMKEHHYTLCKNLLKLPEGVDELPGGSVERTNYIKNTTEVNWNETKKVRISQGDYLVVKFLTLMRIN